MLLLGDQHEHLMHPADYRHHDEDSEGGYDQDEIDGDAAVQEYLDAEGIVDGGDDYDDDDEDPGSDDDDEVRETLYVNCIGIVVLMVYFDSI